MGLSCGWDAPASPRIPALSPRIELYAQANRRLCCAIARQKPQGTQGFPGLKQRKTPVSRDFSNSLNKKEGRARP
jgi:hypothetical protein